MADLVGEQRRFDYSDGDSAEEAILEAVSAAADVSSGSDELAGLIKDWTTRYHFSPARSDLLEPFHWEGLEVLEIGSGCGALTRFLGEAGASVTAIEGSFRRATITTRRCRGLEDVMVVCDDFVDVSIARRFDVVVAVGVLEYAPRFFHERDPVRAFLERARAFLKPDGVFVVGIENRLGLKYFAGAREDHVGEPYYGIEDRYVPADGAITLGRRELSAALEASGLPPREVILPFPDYKHPKVLVREAGLDSSVLDVGELIVHAGLTSRDARAPLLFAEEGAWGAVRTNGLVDDLSNSFLIVAGSQGGAQSLLGDHWLAKAYASNRRRPFKTVTTFRDGHDGVIVEKRRRHPEAEAPAGSLAELRVQDRSDYIPGSTLAARCVRIASLRGATVADVIAVLRPWLDLLAGEAGAAGGRLPGRSIDCVPGNLLLTDEGGGGLRYFDAEWVYHQSVSPERVLFRGILLMASRLARLVIAPALRDMPLRELVSAVVEAYAAPGAPADLPELLAAEAEWVAQVMPIDAATYSQSVAAGLAAPLGAMCRLGAFADSPAVVAGVLAERTHDIELLEAAIAEKDRHITKLEAEEKRVIAEKDRQITQLDAEAKRVIAEKDRHITQLDAEAKRVIAEKGQCTAALSAVEASISWRITAPLRRLNRGLRRP